jgi:hypothetical protein
MSRQQKQQTTPAAGPPDPVLLGAALADAHAAIAAANPAPPVAIDTTQLEQTRTINSQLNLRV